MRLADVKDEELLRRYSDEAQEEAFGELVQRYFNLVWSASWRVTRDADLARDVAQTVFVDLARKAGHLPGKVILAGWLYRAASLAAIKVVRTNVRRAERERKSMEIESHANTSSTAETEVDLLMPMLDEALGKLGEVDRNALVLRFFARKNLSEVGAALGMSDDAAQKRLARALEKVRRHFRSRGLAVSTGAIVATLGIAGAEAAPAGLSLMVAASSLGVAGSTSVPGIFAFASKVQTQIAIMKTKLAVIALATVSVSAPLAVQQKTMTALQRENRSLRDQSRLLGDLRAESRDLVRRQSQVEELQKLGQDHNELTALNQEIAQLRAAGVDPGLYRDWQRAEEALAEARAQRQRAVADIQAKVITMYTVDALKNVGLAARIFASSNHDRFPTNFEEMKNELPASFKGGILLDQFELVQHARAVTESEPELMLFREKAPRQLPDGTWTKAVVLCDGSVQQHISQDGNFDEWEKGMLAAENHPPASK